MSALWLALILVIETQVLQFVFSSCFLYSEMTLVDPFLCSQQFHGVCKEAQFPLLPKTMRVLYLLHMSSRAVYDRNFDCKWQRVQDGSHSQCGVKQMVQNIGLVSFHSQVL